MKENDHHFFAYISRMRFINRKPEPDFARSRRLHFIYPVFRKEQIRQPA